MQISRKNIDDQFFNFLYGICTYNEQDISYQQNKNLFAWCWCKATGHKYKMSLKEWDSLEIEHRKINTDDIYAEVVFNRKTNEVLKSIGSESDIKSLMKAEPKNNWQVGLYESLDFN